MDAIEYLKIKKKICDKSSKCCNCPLSVDAVPCVSLETTNPEKAQEIVLRYKTNTVTYEDIFNDFLKNTGISRDFVLDYRPCTPEYGYSYVPKSIVVDFGKHGVALYTFIGDDKDA